MGNPAAKQDDMINGSCTHTAVTSNTPFTAAIKGLPFAGKIAGGLSSDVKIQGKFAATKESTAENMPHHVFSSVGTATKWANEPDNMAKIDKGSGSVRINGKDAARAGDKATICDELNTKATVVAQSSVSIGD